MKKRSPPPSRTKNQSAPRGRSQRNDSGGGVGPRKSEAQEIQKKFPRLVVGHHAVVEAIKKAGAGEGILWLTRNWESSKDLRELEKQARENKISVEAKPEELLRSLSQGHQGACFFAKNRPRWQIEESYENRNQTVLILDGVEDPHNLGAIIRTAWLMGVSAIVIPQDRAVGLTSTVHKVACGGAEYVPVETVPNLAQFLEELKKYEFWIFGLSHKSTKEIQQIKIPERVAWVLGAEDSGLRITTERACDELVRLPQKEKEASFNVSVAAAMALFETARQKSPFD